MAFDLTCLQTRKAKSRSAISAAVGARLRHDAQVRCGDAPGVARLRQEAAGDAAERRGRALPGQAGRRSAAGAGSSCARRRPRAASSASGATTTSVKIAAMRSAAAASSVRFAATMPPKAETGSQRSARSQASARSSATATPQGLACLTMTIGGRVELRDGLEGGVGVVQVVVGQLLALHLRGGGDAGPRRAVRVEGGALVRVLAVAQRLLQRAGEGEARREVLAAPCREPAGDRRVVGGGARIGRGRQAPAQREGGAALRLDLGQRLGVVAPARSAPRRGRGSWRRRGSSPGRRCRCSRCSRRSRRRPRPSPRTGRGSPPRGRSARCRAPPSARRCSARSRRPSRPPWICGTSVFTRPSRISGKPVWSRHLLHRHARFAQRPRGAAGGQDLDALPGQEARRTPPARSCRKRRSARGGRGRVVGHGGGHSGAPADTR